MFKCSECGAEYKQKPDFCDCGNDVFEEIVAVEQSAKEYDKELAPKHKKSFEEQYPELSSFMETLDPISVVIFGLCIFLSVLSLIFIKPKEQNIAESPKPKASIERKVADINSFWNDTPPKPEVIVRNQEPTIASQITDMISKMSEPKPVQQTVKPKLQQTQKPVVQQKPQTSTKPAAQQPKKAQTTTVKPTQTQTVKKQQTTTAKPSIQQPQQQTPQPVVQKTVPQQPTVNTAVIQAQAAQELKSFKNGLRNTLFRKINFTKVYGDGSCIVDFRVDSTGRLTNKSFSKQSNNNTLNDEVYQAIMSTPVYKAPPNSYSGQILHFSVKFQGGQYEVSLY